MQVDNQPKPAENQAYPIYYPAGIRHRPIEANEPQIDDLPEEKGGLDQTYNPRLGFVRKVFGILSCQLLFTFICITLFQSPLNSYVIEKSRFFVISTIVAAVIQLVTAITICYCPKFSRKVPTNYALLSILTASIAYLVGVSTAFLPKEDVILAALLTLSITITLTIYACTTKRDFTMYGAARWIGFWAMFAFTFIYIGIVSRIVLYSNGIVLLLLAGVSCYGFGLVYDIQLVMGGQRHELSMDDYILAAMLIYVDVMKIFMKILEIIMKLKKK